MLNIDKDVEQLGLSPLAGRHVRIGLQINHNRKIMSLKKKKRIVLETFLSVLYKLEYTTPL